MGLDARRGAGFPPELYDDILHGGKTKSQRSRQAHFASRRRTLVRYAGYDRACCAAEPSSGLASEGSPPLGRPRPRQRK